VVTLFDVSVREKRLYRNSLVERRAGEVLEGFEIGYSTCHGKVRRLMQSTYRLHHVMVPTGSYLWSEKAGYICIKRAY
jgi:hypothetical protein